MPNITYRYKGRPCFISATRRVAHTNRSHGFYSTQTIVYKDDLEPVREIVPAGQFNRQAKIIGSEPEFSVYPVCHGRFRAYETGGGFRTDLGIFDATTHEEAAAMARTYYNNRCRQAEEEERAYQRKRRQK